MENRFEKFNGLILNIWRSIGKIKNREMAKLGLKGNQLQCIFALSSNRQGLSLLKLCAICNEDKGAISRTVKELEKKRLVFVSGEQKYKNPIALTPSGQEIANIIGDKIETMLALGSEGIGARE